jgi:hypothetical protein
MKTIKGITLSIFAVVVLFSAVSLVKAATFTVNDASDVQDSFPGNGLCATAVGTCTLRAAISEANGLAGADIITLPAGVYTITIPETADDSNVNGDFDINSDITINGAGSATTAVQANALPGVAIGRVFHIRYTAPGTTAVINDLTIQNGRYTASPVTYGAGVRVDVGAANSTFNRVVIRANQDGTGGGGLAISGAAGSVTTLNNCTVSNNTAGGPLAGSAIGGGILLDTSSTLNVNSSTIVSNTVSGTSSSAIPAGGGISSTGTLTLTNSNVTTNTSTSTDLTSTAGGLYVYGGTTTIVGSTISGNIAVVTAGTGTAVAGGIYSLQATLNITDSNVLSNHSVNNITPASASNGGIRAVATTIASVTNITNSTIANNTSGGDGGGVANFATSTANSTLNITRSTIRNNAANGTSGYGGGVVNAGVSSTGGLALTNITNSTVSTNTANTYGGGVFNTGTGATTTINFSTIARNTATQIGGGIFQNSTGTTNLKNSIIADNTATVLGNDIYGIITSQDYNHIENVTGGTFFTSRGKTGKDDTTFFALSHDVTGTDPMLGTLVNNGGTTLTHLPALASPVMNTIPSGTSGCGAPINTSQNAVFRAQQTGCEKGATERLTPTAADSSVRGRLLTPIGRGLTNASVILTNAITGEVRIARTTSFGYFNFSELETGDFYVLTVKSKRYVFESRSFILNNDIDDLVLIGQ